jgi:hypothetical protein
VRLHVPVGGEVVEAFLDDFAEVAEYAEGDARMDVGVGVGGVPPFAAADVVDEEIYVCGGAGMTLVIRFAWKMSEVGG